MQWVNIILGVSFVAAFYIACHAVTLAEDADIVSTGLKNYEYSSPNEISDLALLQRLSKCANPTDWLSAYLNKRNQPGQSVADFQPGPWRHSNLRFENILREGFKRFPRNRQPVKGPQCSCLDDFKLRDLGRMYYPRHLPEAVCDPSLCYNHTYSCVKKSYKFKVLRERYSSELPDDHLPLDLRDKWVFDDKELAVACECMRQ